MNIFIICFLIMLIYNVVKNKKSLHMLQQNLYNENNRYMKWVKRNFKSVFVTLDFISVVLIVIAYFVDEKVAMVLAVVAILLYILEAVRLVKVRRLEQVKKPLVVTARVKRLITTITILFLLPIILYVIDTEYIRLVLIITSVMTYLSYLVVLLAKMINKPVEKCVYHYYDTKARNKLKSMSRLKVVGITGSYGKTSSKNILNDILNIKYISLPTPRNLNTEYGLMITINNHLDKFDDIFIAEMGAYQQGEIKTLCDMVHPKYGILTTIGLAHLETFGSPENIQKTKFELIESLPEDGVAVLNGDDPKQTSYSIKSKCKKVWIGIKNKDVDVSAENIKCNHKGSTFDVVFKGDKIKYPFETKLLGNHNIENILAGIALGREFGISIKELQQGVRKVRPVESRLELKDFGYMYQINDAYNSNPVGAKAAVEVLGLMPGMKVVVTPGMTELGEQEEELNKIFGTQIADVADHVILVGEKRTKPIYQGLVDSKFKKDKLHVVNTVYEAYDLLKTLKTKEDMFALFENDLPDTYNE